MILGNYVHVDLWGLNSVLHAFSQNALYNKKFLLPNGQSSPGILQSGQHPSNAILQMPQLSSLATHRHVATAVQLYTKYVQNIKYLPHE